MGNGWHWFIVILTVANIVGMIWLILWGANQGGTENNGEDTLEHSWDGDLQERNNPLPRWWLWLFIGTIIWGFGYLIYYPGLGAFSGTSGWTQIGQYQQERDRIDAVYLEKFSRLAAMDYRELSQDTEAMDIAARLYGGNCATCHGSDARGATGFPNLTDSDWLYGNQPETIAHGITNGRHGIMPGWEAAVGSDGVMELVAYTKSLAKMAHDEQAAVAGKTRYQTFCIACHGADGAGVQALGGPNLTDDVFLHGNSVEVLVDTIANGKAGEMPAHSDLLSSEEIKLLTAYVLKISGS